MVLVAAALAAPAARLCVGQREARSRRGRYRHQIPRPHAKLLADEGDVVKPGQVVAVMDTRDLEASLKKSEALVRQAERSLDEAKANLVQQQTLVKFAQREIDRTSAPSCRKALPPSSARPADPAAECRGCCRERSDPKSFRSAARARRRHTRRRTLPVNIEDNTLVAPKAGPIEYRVANVGEVLPAGGKVFTMLDASYVYMDIYLPTAAAGRIRIGSEARIVLDAYPDHVIPAKVVFVAGQAQFIPKTIETKDERDKLMFRIRVRIDPGRLEGREALVRSGCRELRTSALTQPRFGQPACNRARRRMPRRRFRDDRARPGGLRVSNQ
jgi:HlyD family secretion protein